MGGRRMRAGDGVGSDGREPRVGVIVASASICAGGGVGSREREPCAVIVESVGICAGGGVRSDGREKHVGVIVASASICAGSREREPCAVIVADASVRAGGGSGGGDAYVIVAGEGGEEVIGDFPAAEEGNQRAVVIVVGAGVRAGSGGGAARDQHAQRAVDCVAEGGMQHQLMLARLVGEMLRHEHAVRGQTAHRAQLAFEHARGVFRRVPDQPVPLQRGAERGGALARRRHPACQQGAIERARFVGARRGRPSRTERTRPPARCAKRLRGRA